ncbi:kinesin-like protein costa [Leptinotarsa decemlineata]|uniref:kinesin-like protein costa n=1 Tax=Leptinotarsa decemlineata TaxID=7539 RepID=UPI003D30D178
MEIPIETAVRICPFDYNNGEMVYVQSDPMNNTIQLNNQVYPVNHALPINCCQSTVFTTVAPMVNFLLEGCDVSIVTIGQSGTGKTYTLYGPGFHFAASESEHGIIPRFIREVFSKVGQYRDKSFTIHIAWSQICGDNVQDLLGGGSIECMGILDAFRHIQIGLSNITPKGAHSLFTLTLEQQWVTDSIVQHKVSTVSFADLAGSEKILYDNNGYMQTMPVDIGLQALHRCVTLLSEPYMNGFNINQVPYSQSVLTTLLKDSFGGRAKTLVICCVSPLLQDYVETLYSLQFVYRAQCIKNIVTVNSYVRYETLQDSLDVFGLQFAAAQLLKLVSNAEELFQKLVLNGGLNKTETEQISHWLTLKQECEECLSENSEPHRSLERIEEEIEDSSESISDSEGILEEEESKTLLEKLDSLMDNFKETTDRLVSEASNLQNVTFSETKNRDIPSSSSNTHSSRSANRCRRGSMHSTEEINLAVASSSPMKFIEEDDILDSEQKNEDTVLTYEMKKKVLKQIKTMIEGCQKQIKNLEQTIKVKQDLMHQLLEHKDTQSSALLKINQKYQYLKKEIENTRTKLLFAQSQQNRYSEGRYKVELEELEAKLQDAKSLKDLAEEERKKLMELEESIRTSKKQLEKLRRYKKEGEKRRQNYEDQIKEESAKTNDSKGSSNSEKHKSEDDLKAVALISRSSLGKSNEVSLTISLPNEDLEYLRHEIRNLRKTRDFLLEQKFKLEANSQSKKIFNEYEERKAFQYEEAIEGIDLVMEYKNEILCGHRPACEMALERIEEQGDKLLMDRLMKLTDNEMRVLLHNYFQKVVDLRSSSTKLEMQVADYENENEKLVSRVQNLSHTLQEVRLEGERRIAVQQRQHEDNIHLWMRLLANEEPDQDIPRLIGNKLVPRSVGSTSKQLSKTSSLITRMRIARQEIVPRQLQSVTPAPQAKVTRQKNKLIIQQTTK